MTRLMLMLRMMPGADAMSMLRNKQEQQDFGEDDGEAPAAKQLRLDAFKWMSSE